MMMKSAAAVSADKEENYGLIRPSLIKQLKSILDQYPDNGQILKELLQNAEDAGAQHVKFVYDKNSYGCTKLHHADMATFQGPALYAYNDALFSDQDWTGIRMLQDSIKEADSTKIGRFGLGFKSVFHLTDLPSVLSGERLFFIDPHERYFLYQGSRTSGHLWNIAERQADMQRIPHQFEPFAAGICGCNGDTLRRGHFRGTLFRFPLRRVASELSSTIYDQERVETLLAQFKIDARILLLFLKNVSNIEVCVRNEGCDDARVSFQVSISRTCQEEVRTSRRRLTDAVRIRSAQNISITYLLAVDLTEFNNDGALVSQKTFRYVVNEYYAGGQVSKVLAELRDDVSLSLIPVVGTAIDMDSKNVWEDRTKPDLKTTSNEDAGGEGSHETVPYGHLFCSLPLEAQEKSPTGLPVHVNGFFAISQNRQHLKWPSSGQRIETDKCLLWNRCLIGDLVPLSYRDLVLSAIQSGYCRPAEVYAVLPDLTKVDDKWEIILEPLYQSLFQKPIFYAQRRNNQGEWMKLEDCVFDRLRLEDSETQSLVVSTLVEANYAVAASVDNHILLALGAYGLAPEIITPSLVREALRSRSSLYVNLDRTAKLRLLGFVLKDNDFRDMAGLQLLPVADGSFARVSCSKNERNLYMPTEDFPSSLLPTLTAFLIRTDDMDEHLLYKVKKMAQEGCTQVNFLNKEAVTTLLPKVIPKAWFQQNCIKWEPSTCSLPADWLSTLWLFLRTHYPSTLAQFKGLPILPVLCDSLVMLVSLMSDTSVTLRAGAGSVLSAGMANVLRQLGGIVADDLPQYVRDHAAVIGQYVRLPIADDLVEVMYNAAKLLGERRAIEAIRCETTESEKAEVRELISWLHPRTLQRQHLNFLRQLPVFACSVDSTPGDAISKFCSVEEVGSAAPIQKLPIATRARYLDLGGDEIATKAAAVLGAKFINVTSLLSETFSNEFSRGFPDEATANSVARSIFENFSAYVAEDPSIVKVLSKVPFVQTRKPGGRAAPSALFDPTPPGLRLTLADADVFPSEYCASDENVALLRRMGLKSSEQVTADDLLSSMLRIEHLATAADTFSLARSCSQAVVDHLGRFPLLLWQEANGRLLVEWATSLRWVAAVADKPSLYPSNISWCGTDTMLHLAADVSSSDWAPVVGAVRPVVACGAEIAQAFGWDVRPSAATIVSQLAVVASSYTACEKVKYLTLVTGIFDALSQADSDAVLAAIGKHGLTDWIWHGDGFASCDRIVIKRPAIDMRPYVYTLPSEMLPFVAFLIRCRVQESCSPETYVRLLQSMHQKYSAGEFSKEDANSDTQLAVALLNELALYSLSSDQCRDLLVICQSDADDEIRLRLCPIHECTYCDVDWLRKGFDITEFDAKDGIIFVHPQLPITTAAALGVPTLMSRMLHAEELTLTSFGQSEPLTSRLRKLLDEYSDGLAIPKEIIQNADDAGASEVCFAFDERTNGDSMKYLIDEGMRCCQGPALWAYNDATFSERDFESITRLGGAMKESEPDKIGRFGLGFNAVYNVTDVPSFVTRNVLVIFDPHTTHLGRGIRDHSRPGIRINLDKNRMLLRRLPDQFRPYEGVFGCRLGASDDDEPVRYDGTLFRLPLRSKEQAARSEISNLPYDRDRVITLLQLFVQNAHNMLLFSQNVRKVSFYHIPPDGSPHDPVLLFGVSKKLLHVVRELKPASDWMKKLTPAALETEHDAALSRNCGSLRAAAEYTQLLWSQNNKSKKNLKAPRASIVVGVSLTINDAADCVGLTTGDSADSFWLISSCVGSQQSLDMAQRRTKEGYVPAAGVACLLEPFGESRYVAKSLGHGMTGGRGRAYCYMPLPVPTGLPVHVNSVFALHSNRRQLSRLTEDERTSIHVDWNNALLEDAVCGAYIQMLVDLRHVLPTDADYPLYEIWPLQDSADEYFLAFVRRFYSCAVKADVVPLVYRHGKPVTFDNVIFLDSSIAGSQHAGLAAQDVLSTCCGGKMVSSISDSAYKSFLAVGLEDAVQEKMFSVERFYGEIFFPNLDRIAADARRCLVLFALGLRNLSVDKLLRNHACIPSSPNGTVLRRPGDLIHPMCKAACLYGPEDGRFPHEAQFQDPGVLAALERLGIIVGDLAWDDIVERCSSLQFTWSTDRQLGRSRQHAVLLFLDRLLLLRSATSDSTSEGVAEKLSSIAFLSVMQKPVDFPLMWSGEAQSDQLMCPSEMFTAESRYLVSATCCIVDDTGLSNRVRDFLRLTENRPRMEHVITQMEHALAVDVAALSAPQFAEFQRCMYALYAFLQDQCIDDPIAADQISAVLANRPCILHDRTILQSGQVAFEFPYNCAPYLYVLPTDLSSKYASLMSLLGVKRRFEVGSYMQVLNELNRKADGQPLGEKDLDLAVRMVTQLNGSMKQTGTPAADVERNYGPILVPNAVGCMVPASTLCYNDCPWLSDAKLVSLVHPDVTFQTSACLGVRTKRQEALRQYSRGIPFGQKERLTNSLRRLLDSYPFDHEILKELVQNADDAGATEIHFVVDRRVHSDDRVFDACWRPLQGPALCVYNNRPFSDVDLEGIQRFGEGSKSRDPASTGQYGIGFSSVYHLTDVPSLLATGTNGGKMLCVFDPMCKYVPGATTAEPGMRYDSIDALKAAFPDVFSCYMEENFSPGGTIFRFPFRTAQMAEKSEISKTAVTGARIQSILDRLKEEAFEILLFTNCLEEISISDVDSRTGNLTNTYTVKALLSKEDKILRQRLIETKRSMAGDGNYDLADTLKTTKPRHAVLTLLVTDNRGCQEKWLVSHRLGFDIDLKLPLDVEEAFENGELALLPYGGVACQVERRLHGRIDCASRPSRAFCFLPLPVETELPVHVNGHFALGYENRRHLWTNADNTANNFRRQWNDILCQSVIAPAYVELLRVLRTQGLNCTVVRENVTTVTCSRPMLLSSLRAFMAFFPGYSPTKPQWAVLSTAVYKLVESLAAPLLASVGEIEREERSPVAATASSAVDVRCWQLTWLPPIYDDSRRVFFRKMDSTAEPATSQKQASLLGKFKGWFGLSSAEPSHERPTEEILEEVLLACGLKLVESTPELYDNFRCAGVEVDYMTAESVLAFFRGGGGSEDDDDDVSGAKCLLGELPVKLENSPFRNEKTFSIVFKYVSAAEDFYQQLDGLPLLLKADNTVDRFSKENPVFLSEYSDLAPNSGHLFTKWVTFPGFTGSKLIDLDVFQDFSVTNLAELLPSVLPDNFFCNETGSVPWQKGNLSSPSGTWIGRLWKFVRVHFDKLLNESYPLTKDDKLNSFKELIIPLKDWCVVPAKTSAGYRLYSPSAAAGMILDVRNPGSENRLVGHIIQRMKFPELDVGAMQLSESDANADVVSCLAVTLDRPCELLTMLHSRYGDPKQKDSNVTLSPDSCGYLLKYFCANVEALRAAGGDESAVDQLRDLPIFRTICGDIIRLTGCFVYTLPEKIPTNGIDVWQSRSGTVFLAGNDAIQPLYDFLGCASVGPLDVYCRFIFQHFEYFPREERLVHLHHVYTQYLKPNGSSSSISHEEREGLIDSLRELAFLEDEQGDLQPASFFYDPENVVFRVMLPDGRFAPPADRHFRESEWYSFLALLGMVRTVSSDKYLEFAKTVASESSDRSAATTAASLTKSKVLVKHLYSTPELLHDPVVNDIIKVPFIVPDPTPAELTDINPQYGAVGDDIRLPFICFYDAVSKEHEKLCWTSSCILPSWAGLDASGLSADEQGWLADKLQIQRNPRLDIVLRHLQNLCGEYGGERRLTAGRRAGRIGVFRAIYRYLGDSELDDEIAESLGKIACVLVDDGRRLVLPSQTVVNMYDTDEIRPYLYRLPLDIGEHRRLFLRIGATDRATVAQFVETLAGVRRDAGKDQMTPNELVAAWRAVRGLLEALETTSASAVHQQLSNGSSVLYLPSEDGRLVDAARLVFNDAPAYYDRVRDFNLRFVADLRDCFGAAARNRTTAVDDLLAALPARLRPAMLSAVVQETLVESCRRAASSSKAGGLAERIGDRLRSDQFLRAVVRLVRHEAHKSGRKVDETAMFAVLDRLSTIVVRGAPRITTHLVLKGRPIAGSEVEKSCFVERAPSAIPDVQCWNVFIRDDEETGGSVGSSERAGAGRMSQDLLISLAETINGILSGILHDSVLYLLPALSCWDADHIDACMNSLNVRVDHSSQRSTPGSSGASGRGMAALPPVGSPISDDIKRLCRPCVGSSSADGCTLDLRPGEYVGCSRQQPDGAEVIVYGLIIEELVSPDDDDRMYLIDLGGGQNGVIASRSKMFKFVRQ